jgi:hypothetical protein
MEVLEKQSFLTSLKEVAWEDLVVENYLGIPDRYQVKLPEGLEQEKQDFMTKLGVPKKKLNEWTFVFDEIRTQFNRIHFKRGISPILRGLGFGYKMYRALIEKLKYACTEPNATMEAAKVWHKLIQDPTLYYLKTSKGLLVVSKTVSDNKVTEIVREYCQYYDIVEESQTKHNVPAHLMPNLQTVFSDSIIVKFEDFCTRIK